MRKLLCLVLILLLPLCALAEGDLPAWDYPIAPEILQDPNDYIRLANRENLLDGSYVPSDLVRVTAKHVSGTFQLRKAVNDALLTMFAAANQDGCTLYVKSAYRSYQTQRTMYYNRLEKNGGKDDGWVSYPGASDHQTGLGADILNYAWRRSGWPRIAMSMASSSAIWTASRISRAFPLSPGICAMWGRNAPNT